MHVGFNHNIRYKEHLYHVQTEDCGVKKATIVTLLYRGGTILSSKRTSYADVVQSEEVELVVEELMKAQHKEMMRRLTKGEFDAKIAAFNDASPAEVEAAEAAPPVPPTGETPAPTTKDVDLDSLIFAYLTGTESK